LLEDIPEGTYLVKTDDNAFKVCTSCKRSWHTREDLLADPACNLIGYQRSFMEHEAGVFLFTHILPKCGTTIGIPADEFLDLNDGPRFDADQFGMKWCSGHCLDVHNTEPCPQECEYAFVRDVMQTIKNWPNINS